MLKPDFSQRFRAVEGIYFPQDGASDYAQSKELWENAAAGWIRTGYGAHAPGGLWKQFPQQRRFDSIVDLGCGYGRHSIFLSEQMGVQCDRYYAFDIAEAMLRRLLECKAHFDFFPKAEFTVVCMPLQELPIADNSVEIVYSSSVFMHLNRPDIVRVLGEIQRILKPGGSFIFNDSFHHKDCPSYQISNLFRRLKGADHKAMYLQQYTLADIETLMQESRLADKTGDYTITPNSYEVVPPKFQQFLPGGKWLNDKLIRAADPEVKQTRYASSYSIYSENLGLK
ncbi:class I SAM-dependent methyltransferase [Prochlorothrix hollandica]|uniref:class I SAM-dependent methyltransferase n=1 Tax=Prochlorothrix hollandica TaxID=1223 RepID=UPI0011D2559C|nr:class I SAM-dependent methyltransferase [Prochlorothrix hollandica]